MKLKEFADYLEEIIGMDGYIDGQFSHGKPDFGTIDNLRDAAVALAQKRKCGNCSSCYWNGHCSEYPEELVRIFKECAKEEEVMNKPEQVTCGECIHCSSTNPRICMNPDSFAKHSYVEADDYCSKGERYA